MSQFVPQSNRIYEGILVDNFRDLISSATNRFHDKIAFTYKKDASAKNPEYIKVVWGIGYKIEKL